MDVDARLAELGYVYIEGPSGNPSDWVLRQTADNSKGFEWKGQENYDDLGAAVTAWTKASLATIGGLCPVTVDKKATAYVSPAGVGAGVDPATPRLLLVHGSMPGGSCGIWGRSLCINVSTLEGAMFDYIRRAHERGWIVIVADPFSDVASPHRHMLKLSEMMLMKGGPVMVVGHSYGAAMALGMLKGNHRLQPRVTALALTDGMVWSAGGWTAANLLDERPPTDLELKAAVGGSDQLKVLREKRDKIAGYAKLAPKAFRAGNDEDRAFLQAVGRNWVASSLAVGARETQEGALMSTVSAGVEAHPSTTFAATEDVFAFLDRAARRRRKRAFEP